MAPRLPSFVNVWVEAGREGQAFTYANPGGMPLAVGDLVLVPLRGRRHAGLVVACLEQPPAELEGRALLPLAGCCNGPPWTGAGRS